MIRAREDTLDRQIRNLTTLRRALRHVADCPAPSHLECPTFRRLIRVAGQRKTDCRPKGGLPAL